jgi:hypothetical protein
MGLTVLHNLFAGASQQLVLIRVTGNIQKPEIRREAFPGVNQALQPLSAASR